MEQNLRDQILNFNTGRLSEMVQLKYAGMAENAFRFFRGTCHLFYARLCELKQFPSSPLAWLCGDLHLENFGSYRGENGLVYFDLNDFDEGILAPALWEVIRLITSIFVAFEVFGIGEDQATNLAGIFLNSYAGTLCKGKAMAIDPRTAGGIVQAFLDHAENRSYRELLGKRTISKGKKIRLSLDHEKHFKLNKALKHELIDHMSAWLDHSDVSLYNYKVKDVVFRFAGTGSLGVKRYLFLLKSTTAKGKYLLVDMKQSFPSSLRKKVAVKQPRWKHESERIVAVQQRMQYVSAALLATTSFKGDTFVLQEMHPVEDTFDFSLVAGNYRSLIRVISDMGMLTASAQLRSGGMDGSATIDQLKAFGTDSAKWKEELLQVAKALADQNTADYGEFMLGYELGQYTGDMPKQHAGNPEFTLS